MLKNLIRKILVSMVLVLILPVTALAKEPVITDLENTDDSYSQIQWVLNQGYMELDNGEFLPNKFVKRDEFTLILANICNDLNSLRKPLKPSFKDVTIMNKYYKYIETEKQFMSSFPSGKSNLFKPSSYLTREEACMSIVKVMGYSSESPSASAWMNKDISDVSKISTKILPFVSTAVNNELINIREDNNQSYIDPKDNITRRQLAALVYNGYHFMNRDYLNDPLPNTGKPSETIARKLKITIGVVERAIKNLEQLTNIGTVDLVKNEAVLIQVKEAISLVEGELVGLYPDSKEHNGFEKRLEITYEKINAVMEKKRIEEEAIAAAEAEKLAAQKAAEAEKLAAQKAAEAEKLAAQKAALQAEEERRQTLRYNLRAEPITLDVSKSNSTIQETVIQTCFEGLTRKTAYNIIQGVAKGWEITPDGLIYTFHLRPEAKWSDGQAVTAKDFYYSWERLLNPKTEADSASLAFVIKNAKRYHQKEVTVAELGIKVLDPQTFQVTLETPVAYFPMLCTMAVFAPLRQDIVEANPAGWGHNAVGYVGNGPFVLTNWEHGNKLEFAKNPNYWRSNIVKLNKLIFTELDETAALAALDKGELELLEMTTPNAFEKAAEDGSLMREASFHGVYLKVNTTKTPLNLASFRIAMSLAMNRNLIAMNETKYGKIPSQSIVPPGVYDEYESSWQVTNYQYDNAPLEPNIAKSSQLLTQAGINPGSNTLRLLYIKSGGWQTTAELVQKMLQQAGINVVLDGQEFGVVLAQKTAGNFDLVLEGWIGDLLDPMAFFEMLRTGNPTNYGKYSNKKYDDLIQKSIAEQQPGDRKIYLKNAELILENDMPVIPLYAGTNPMRKGALVRDVYTRADGSVYFDNAFITKTAHASNVTDEGKPFITSSSVADGAVGVDLDKSYHAIYVYANERLKECLTIPNIKLMDSMGIAAEIVCQVAGTTRNTFIITALKPLKSGEKYTLTIPKNTIIAQSGACYNDEIIIRFTTK